MFLSQLYKYQFIISVILISLCFYFILYFMKIILIAALQAIGRMKQLPIIIIHINQLKHAMSSEQSNTSYHHHHHSWAVDLHIELLMRYLDSDVLQASEAQHFKTELLISSPTYSYKQLCVFPILTHVITAYQGSEPETKKMS